MDDSLDRYMDSDSGKAFMQKSTMVLPLEKGTSLFIPSGYCMYMFVYEGLERGQNPGFFHVLSLPLSSAFCRSSDMTSREKHCIMTANHACMDDKARTSQMWADRLEFFKTLYEP